MTITGPGGVVRNKSAIGWDRGFTGYQVDTETGLCYARYRMYSPQLGRFLSRDPLRYASGMGLYGAYFVPGDTDPFGLDPCQKIRDKLANIRRAIGDVQRKIANLEASIARRQADLPGGSRNNPQNLPQQPPTPDAPPSASVQGHLDLIGADQANLAARRTQLAGQRTYEAVLAAQLIACEAREAQRLARNARCCRLRGVRMFIRGTIILTFILECPGDSRRPDAGDSLEDSPEPPPEEPADPPTGYTPVSDEEFDRANQGIDPNRPYGEVMQDLINQGVLTPAGGP